MKTYQIQEQIQLLDKVFQLKDKFLHILILMKIHKLEKVFLIIWKKYYKWLVLDKIKLINIINQFKFLEICVIGDLIIDEYITCQALGMSQEDPTIVISPIDSRKFVGGAGIVAAHASGHGAISSLISVTGEDDIKDYGIL